MAWSDCKWVDTPDRCYCSSNGECAYCLRVIALAEQPYGVCADDDCSEDAQSEGYCAECLDRLVSQWERQIEKGLGS